MRCLFAESHAKVVSVLSDMVATCRYYLELCPTAEATFTEPEGSFFDPESSINKRNRLDAMFSNELKQAPPIIITPPSPFPVGIKLSQRSDKRWDVIFFGVSGPC